MEAIIFFSFILIVYGITNTVVFANGPFHIFKKLHEYMDKHHPILGEGLSCMICSAWWVGMSISAVNLLLPFPIALTPMNMVICDRLLFPIIIFLDGAIASGANWLIHTAQEAMERSNT